MIARRKRIVLYFPQQSDAASGVPYAKDILPVALLAIAAWPVRDGYEVVVIDGGLYPQAEAHRRVLEACEGALLYGTTGILGFQVTDGTQCTRQVRARFPSLPAVIGGWFASSAPELVLAPEDGRSLYDAVAIGQGELTFRELVAAFDSGTALEDVPGLALWRDGGVVRTAARGAADWSELADVPWHLVDFEPYRRMQLAQRGRREGEAMPAPPDARAKERRTPWVGISYYSSWGCPLGCAFCCSPEVSGLRWKAMPAERMLDDLAALQERWGFDVVRFYDANFGVHEKRARAFADGLLARREKLWHYVFMQADSVVRYAPSTLDAMAASGLYVALIGAETGSDSTMAELRKTTRGDTNLDAAQALARRGVVAQLTYMLGFPGEERASMLATIDQVRRVQVECPLSAPMLWPYRPIPGTPLYRAALEQGFRPPRTLEEWGRDSAYLVREAWPGRIPPDVQRRRRLLNHYVTLARGRSAPGVFERRARRRLERDDWRFAAIEAKAFDVWHRLGRAFRTRGSG